MAQRNNNNIRLNRGRTNQSSNINNCSCSYRLMYIMARNPTVSGNHPNNTNNASSNTSRRTRASNQRQLDGANQGIIRTRRRARNNPIRANFFIEIRALEHYASNAPDRVHNSGRSSMESEQMSRGRDYTNNSDSTTNVVPLNGREECLVCLSNLSEYVLVNCRHLCLCGDCVTHFRRQRHCDDDTPSTRCPICRAPILSNPRRHNLN